jgi:hypothetical protein
LCCLKDGKISQILKWKLRSVMEWKCSENINSCFIYDSSNNVNYVVWCLQKGRPRYCWQNRICYCKKKFKCESLVFLNKSLKHEKCFNMGMIKASKRQSTRSFALTHLMTTMTRIRLRILPKGGLVTETTFNLDHDEQKSKTCIQNFSLRINRLN